MKRIFEWIGGFALIAFSFYFTDKVSLLVASKSDLMEEIKSVSSIYETDAVNAEINAEENTIIPGKYGKKVDSENSYLNMRDFGSFNENYLVFTTIKPDISLEDNKDKYIQSGNGLNRSVSLVVEKNDSIIKYLNSQDIKYNLIIEASSEIETNDNIEIINGAKLEQEFKNIHSLNSSNTKICINGYSNIELCNKNSYYIIDPILSLQNSSIVDVKNKITSGSIILISSSSKIENIQLILKEINYKDLSIVHISDLISEKES